MAKEATRFSVLAYGQKVGLMPRRLNSLVQSWSQSLCDVSHMHKWLAIEGRYVCLRSICTFSSLGKFKVRVGRSVPGYAQPVEVEDDIACFDIVLGALVVLVREELRKIVIGDLLDQGVLRRDQDIFEKARLGGRDVCNPTGRCQLGTDKVHMGVGRTDTC